MSICVFGIFVADLCFFSDSIPIKGQTVLGKRHMIGPGGKGSNQAIAAARSGGRVSFISKLGKDNYSELALSLYREAGINFDGIQFDPINPTGAAGIMINEKTGENAINVVPGAAGTIDQSMIDEYLPIIKNSKIFLTQLETPKDVTFYALKKAKECGATTILNPAPASAFSKDFFELIDFFTPNETEAEFYTGIKITNEKEAKQAADKLINLGIKKIIITLGEKGLFYSDGQEEIHLKANSVKAIDTTGAGDAFNGALAFSLSKGKPIKACLELANKAAGLSTTKLGAGDAMPFIKDIS